jgi:hypothetical protein
MPHCNWDGTDCYEARILASITSISANSGFSSGGQRLQIYGHGFIDQMTQVTVDSINCSIESVSSEQIVCTTQEKVTDPSFTPPTQYVGQ